MNKFFQYILAGVLICLALPSHAHKPSDSYLSLRLDQTPMQGRWDIAIRDLEFAIGIDTNGDREVTWSELKARHQAIANYAFDRFRIFAGDQDCSLQSGPQMVEKHSDGAYTVLHFSIQCPASAKPLKLEYGLFFGLDPTHRGLLKLQSSEGVRSAVLSPDNSTISLNKDALGAWQQFSAYVRQGVWHIWIGYDHILFLLLLLLPTVLQRKDGQWYPVPALRCALFRVAGIVTAFTLAHSITLTMAVLNWVSLPTRWVESAIAATVLLAAINNMFPLIQRMVWTLVFALGLIHGFGFANVLMDLGLPPTALALALFGFNFGVELGQLAIVTAFVPLVYLVRRSSLYRHGGLQIASLAIGTVAVIWLVERSLNLSLNLPWSVVSN